MAHKTLVGGTAYSIGGGKTLVGGTAYSITGGRTLVDGTGYDISFSKPASSLAVGSSVYFKVDGTKREFIVVHQGRPSSIYSSTCSGTWLLMKDVWTTTYWDTENNDYKNSNIYTTYLDYNATYSVTFYKKLDSNIKSSIKQVYIPYVNGTGMSGSLATGSSGLYTKIFLLSAYEIGYTQSDNSYVPKDGACLDYFSGGSSTKRVAYLNGTATEWWLRSPLTNSDSYDVWYISNRGYCYDGNCNGHSDFGVRPAFILPSDFDLTNYLA